MCAVKRIYLFCKKGLFSRIENPFYKGIPDVNYLMNGVEGWIELKYVKSFPKKELTPVSIPHYTKEQKMWHKVRYDAGGNTAIILQVDKYYFIVVKVITKYYVTFPCCCY